MLNCSTVSSYSVTHCTVVLVYCRHITAPLFTCAVQGGDGQWVVGRGGAALEDKREYQQMLSEGRRRNDQLREVRHIVPSDNAVSNGGYHIKQQQLQLERAREVEQRLMTELQQLTREKEQVTRENDQVTREKEQVTREKEQVCSSYVQLLLVILYYTTSMLSRY